MGNVDCADLWTWLQSKWNRAVFLSQRHGVTLPWTVWCLRLSSLQHQKSRDGAGTGSTPCITPTPCITTRHSITTHLSSLRHTEVSPPSGLLVWLHLGRRSWIKFDSTHQTWPQGVLVLDWTGLLVYNQFRLANLLMSWNWWVGSRNNWRVAVLLEQCYKAFAILQSL